MQICRWELFEVGFGIVNIRCYYYVIDERYEKIYISFLSIEQSFILKIKSASIQRSLKSFSIVLAIP